jgi:hypothetical protein
MAPFHISLQVHHVSRDLHCLTASLQTQPLVCMTAGEVQNGQARRTSVWHGPLFQGTTQAHFDGALEALVALLQQHEATLAEFAGDDAMMEILFTFRVSAADAQAGQLAHSVNLQPFLLYELAKRQIGVKVQTAYESATS